MGMALDDIAVPRPQVPLRPARWLEYLTLEGLPLDFLSTADHAAFHLPSARADGEIVAAARGWARRWPPPRRTTRATAAAGRSLSVITPPIGGVMTRKDAIVPQISPPG
jgi:hypothetical protein